jgi:uncharacterized protein YjiS (DUF1127 family)
MGVIGMRLACDVARRRFGSIRQAGRHRRTPVATIRIAAAWNERNRRVLEWGESGGGLRDRRGADLGVGAGGLRPGESGNREK